MSNLTEILRVFLQSRVQPYFGENSLFQRAFIFARTSPVTLNKTASRVTKTTNSSYTGLVFGYTESLMSKLWQLAFPGWSKGVERLKQKLQCPILENENRCETVVFDFDPKWIKSFVEDVYLRLLNQNLLGITKESLDILKFQSTMLQGLQDFEVVRMLKSMFGSQPTVDTHERKTFSLMSIVWRSSGWLWENTLDRVGAYTPTIPWLSKAEVLAEKEIASADVQTSNNSDMTFSVSTLLVCEISVISQTVTDTSEYAITSTSDLVKDALLLFVPMEILTNTTELLKSSMRLAAMPPVEVFWQLFDYVTIWGLDITEDLCSLPEINYVAVDDDDFHFVVNMPRIKRPILFVGVR